MLRQNVSRFGVLSVLWACALIALPARAQVVFEDNFDGNALGAHWITPPASNWVHDVSGGMLNVHRVVLPIPHPKGTPIITAAIGTSLLSPHAGDFLATMRLVWEPETVPEVFLFLLGATNSIADIRFNQFAVEYSTPVSTQAHLLPPGAAVGAHELAIERVGSIVRFSLDGSMIGTLPDSGGRPMTSIALWFRNAYPIPSGGPIHIDSVRVVPGPGPFVLAVITCVCATRRRR